MKKYTLFTLILGFILLLPMVTASINSEGYDYTSKQITGDAYANEALVAYSAWYANEENALGLPDNQNATIYLDYGYGYLTLDMGYEEDILDETGVDFTVIAGGDSYRVGVSTSASSSFSYFPMVNGSQSFDLANVSETIARYVRIELMTGSAVYVDGIVAFHYNTPSDADAPEVSPVDDVVLEIGINNVTLTWNVSDEYPTDYRIYVNGTLESSGSWQDLDAITYTATDLNIGAIYNITIQVFDGFLHETVDEVLITVPIPITTPPPLDVPMFLTILGVTAVFIVLIIIILRKRNP